MAIQPFRDAIPQRIRGYFFPYDYHWNQAGADVFAHFMARRLEEFSKVEEFSDVRATASHTPLTRPRQRLGTR